MDSSTSKPWVDSHFHVFEAGIGQPGARYVPAYAAALAQWQSLAAAAGVTRGVVVQPSFLGTDNRQLLAALAAHPQTLRGIAVVSPGIALAELGRLDAAGVRGLRLNLAGRLADLDPWCRPQAPWEALQALGWHLQLHTDAGALPGVLERLPQDLPLVVDHMAKPVAARADDPTVRALVQRARRAPVHVKLSGAYRLGGVDAGALARLWVGELGPQAVVWGSDWPCTNHEDQADYGALRSALHDWVPPEVAQAALADNALGLYWAR